MSRRQVAPGVWEPEGPRPAVRTDPRIRGYAIESGPAVRQHTRTQAQREYRAKLREQGRDAA